MSASAKPPAAFAAQAARIERALPKTKSIEAVLDHLGGEGAGGTAWFDASGHVRKMILSLYGESFDRLVHARALSWPHGSSALPRSVRRAAELLNHHARDLTFFSLSAFHYYMPAFLLAVLEHPHDPSDIPGKVCFRFAYDGDADTRREQRLRVSQFSSLQREVLCSFIVWDAERSGEPLDADATGAIALLSV